MSLILRNKANRPWNPWTDMDRNLERLFNEWPSAKADSAWTPSVDIHETEHAYVLALDLPGMKKEEIDIAVKDNTLTIRGERKRTEDVKEGQYTRFERRYGKFERTFTVRDGFDAEKVDARYQDGVLSVTMPKREEMKPRQIEVKVR